ncbi:MAG: methionyl-tRNA formyltransferase [Candidatus Krumholzibacteria bacterium]|nr:methionyl-tRNA formyltransferase [Candidatus Krumholzibacteria bacterium]
MSRIVFFGSPDFAVPSLEALSAGPMRPALVVTQPDRPAGRGRRPAPTAVRRAAERLGIETEVIGSFRRGEGRERLASLGADFFVVAAFGLIFPEEILRLPRRAAVNLHASLLPAWRGASPVNMAIVSGDRITGVSTIRMVRELDAGPVYMQRAIEIGERETAGELSGRLAAAGAALLVETIERIEGGALEPSPQPDEGITYAPRLKKRDGEIPWHRRAASVHDHIRGMNPWPGSYTAFGGTLLKVLAAEPAPETDHDAAPGTVLDAAGEAVTVACGSGAVRLLRLQSEGRRPLPAEQFLRGFRLSPGDRLTGACHD